MQGKKLTRFNLEYCFNNAIKSGAKYIGVMVELPHANDVEVIINPSSNFEQKFRYYMDNYNENLEHNHDNQVKIVGLTFGDSFEEIEQDFLEY